MALKWCIH